MRAHGEGTVYQRGDGRWMATLYDAQGKRRWVYGRTRGEVLDKRKNALRNGLPSSRPVTVATWLARWQAGLQLRPSTTKDYASKAKRISAALGRVRLDRLTSEQIERAHAAWRDEGLSPGMVRNLHRVLHAALNSAVSRGALMRNPASRVRVAVPQPTGTGALTADQTKTLLAKTADQPYGVRWWLALLLGMRQGEVLSLQWSDVDLERGVLFVRRETKTRTSRRALPLAAPIAVMLARLPRTSVFVFPRASGERRDSKADWTEWQMLLASCDLPRVRVHDARHTTPTLLLELGVPARVVSEILGHSTTRLTMDTYTHVHDPLMRDAVERLTTYLTTEATTKLTTESMEHGGVSHRKSRLKIVR